MKLKAKQLQGKKAYLRPITEDDTQLIVNWRNQENVKKYFFFREEFTGEMHRNWIKTKLETGEAAQFIVCLKDGDIPVGSTYLRDINYEEKTAEYGVFLGEESIRGKGIGKEVLNLTLKFAWEELLLEKVYARAISTNAPSINSFLNSGFRVEEEVKNVPCSDGSYADMVFMSKIKITDGDL